MDSKKPIYLDLLQLDVRDIPAVNTATTNEDIRSEGL